MILTFMCGLAFRLVRRARCAALQDCRALLSVDLPTALCDSDAPQRLTVPAKPYHAAAMCGCTAVLGTESAAQPGVEWVAYRTALMPYIVHATAQGSVIGRLEKGYFGELALLYDQPRAASIISR